MGEVYRARDPRLQRDVAIKVLPDLFARDPDRLARFEREARTLAALNHPGIAQVYGVEGSALVMELVDGEDLSQRIARTGAIALDEALPIALQICEALAAAHDQGIVHRDLKPANIKIRPDGTAKVLDFGLAKAIDPVGSPSPSDNSPTLTSPLQLSNLGVILGTAAYMAPEQARGRPVDKRVDIWAFGCVLFEMLAGQRPFEGEDITDTLAAIVRADPKWGALPAETPGPLRTLLRRCLQKDRRDRLPDIGAARIEVQELLAGGSASPVTAAPSARRGRASLLPWILFAGASVLAVAVISDALKPQRAVEVPMVKASIVPPAPLSGAPALRMNLSPDGTRLAFVAPDDAGRNVLWVRPLDSMAAQPLAGTLNAMSPLWSPDGRWIAFIADNRLKKVEATGGAVVTVAEANGAPPGTWNAAGIIIFSGANGQMTMVRDSGGTPKQVTDAAATGSTRHIAPFFLPDGRHFLFAASAAGSQKPGIYVGSIDSTELKRVMDGSCNPAYAAGHMIYLRDTTLVAQPFDATTHVLSGEPTPIAEGVQINPATGTGAYAISQNGVLVYQTGEAAGTQLAWRDRNGKQLETLGEPASYRDVYLSPDGRLVSFTVGVGGRSDVWIHDIDRGLRRRFTFSEGAQSAVWSPDGRYLVYAQQRADGLLELYRKDVSGVAPEKLLLTGAGRPLPLQITRDGKFLLYASASAQSQGDLWMLSLDGPPAPRRVLAGTDREMAAAVSPDGRWLAYAGSPEVYVTSFPDAAGKWQVSNGGGQRPQWSRSGTELYYTSGDRFMVAEVNTTGAQFDPGRTRQLFNVRVPAPTLGTRATFAVSPDGQRFLINTWDTRGATTPITVVTNWPAMLRK